MGSRDAAVRTNMTAPVHVVAPESSLTEAREAMHAHGVRHLPVLREGSLVGVVTLSDLYAAEAILQADPDATTVEQLMARDIFTVAPDTSLRDVAEVMAERHLGCALVVEDGTLVGMFTSTDACRALAVLLRARE